MLARNKTGPVLLLVFLYLKRKFTREMEMAWNKMSFKMKQINSKTTTTLFLSVVRPEKWDPVIWMWNVSTNTLLKTGRSGAATKQKLSQ